MINKFEGNYAFLDVDYPCSINILDKTYSSAQEAIQSYKCNHTHDFNGLTGEEIYSKAKSIKSEPWWHDERETIMFTINMTKFQQNTDLGLALMNTGREELVFENLYGDKYWGTVDGVGDNKLGKILMYIRDILLSSVASENGESAKMQAKIHVSDYQIDIELGNAVMSYPCSAYMIACAFMQMAPSEYVYFNDCELTVKYDKHFLTEEEFIEALSDITDKFEEDSDMISYLSKDLVRYYLRDLGKTYASEALIYNGF